MGPTGLPRFEPMLAVAWPRPFSHPDWSFEVKWDGVRALLYWDGERAELRSRRGRDVTGVYPELSAIRLGRPCILDGEVVAFDDEGRPSFERLQGRMNLTGPARAAVAAREIPVTYVVFDLLYERGEELLGKPLRARRSRLKGWELPEPWVLSAAVVGEGEAFFSAAAERGLEGMVAKRLDSPYRSGARSADWRKVAARRRARVVVGGFTPGGGGRSSTFGALLLGVWEGESLRYVGSVGTGFDDRSLVLIRRTLDRLTRPASPFAPDPALPAGRWVEPTLVALVEFKEWTSAGRLRAPSFKGFTDDPPGAVTWEEEGPPGRS